MHEEGCDLRGVGEALCREQTAALGRSVHELDEMEPDAAYGGDLEGDVLVRVVAAGRAAALWSGRR